ncbi:MAG: SRPBCC domain-containing protein [Solirubrobacterales bacterium]
MSERTLVVTRVYDATPQQIWDVWKNPEHLAKFFGPEDSPVDPDSLVMDFRVGGEFSLNMVNQHNGDVYPMRAEYIELDEPSKIVFRTSGGITGTVEFEDLNLAGKTLVTWTTVAEMDDALYSGATVGTHSAIDQLGKVLAAAYSA